MGDSKLQSLSEIFNNRIFRVPDFQRGYSWEERQLDDFGKMYKICILTKFII